MIKLPVEMRLLFYSAEVKVGKAWRDYMSHPSSALADIKWVFVSIMLMEIVKVLLRVMFKDVSNFGVEYILFVVQIFMALLLIPAIYKQVKWNRQPI